MSKESWQRFEERNKNYFVIEGLASTDAEDSYGERIDQDGIDLSYVAEDLVTINIEHGDGFPIKEMSVVGIITDAEIREEGLWIRGRIYRDHQYSDAIFKKLNDPDSELSLSIEMSACTYGEGRFSNVVLGGVLTGVALTVEPSNEETYAKLSKSIRDPTLRALLSEMNKLRQIITSTSQRTHQKKRVIVKVLRVT